MEYCNTYIKLLDQYIIEKEASDNERRFEDKCVDNTPILQTAPIETDPSEMCTHRAKVTSYLIDRLCRKIDTLEEIINNAK